jgi:hypothetical protein
LTFHGNKEAFPNPRVQSKDEKKTSLPPILDNNLHLDKCIIQYVKQNLHKLSAELLYSYIHKIVPPALLDERRAELTDELYIMQQLLNEN